jgi:hypothetical protein
MVTKKPLMQHIMIDHETLGTRGDSVVMSIGAVKFDVNSDAIDQEGFYASISINSNIRAGRHISEDTIKWWLQQSPEAQKVFFEPKISIEQALEDFVSWVGPGDFTIWSNGADFDIPQITHLLDTHGLDIPWKFWNHRCYRTMKSLPFAKNAAKPELGVKHNALSDAINQAQHLQNIFKEMKK